MLLEKYKEIQGNTQTYEELRIKPQIGRYPPVAHCVLVFVPTLYPRCQHERKEITLDSKKIQLVAYNMPPALEATCEKYASPIKQVAGEKIKWQTAYTPFLPEDHKEAPAAAPSNMAPGAPTAECP